MVLSCTDPVDTPDQDLAFFLVRDYELLENEGYNRIDESTVEVILAPLIEYEDIISYDPDEYIYELSDEAVMTIKDLDPEVYTTPFAVMIDGELIYTGYFWPSLLSSSCDWLVLDPLMADYYHGIKIQLGYPGLVDGEVIPDNRNDSRIIELLKRDKKLKG